jgi:hypothetical protein
LVKDFLAKNNMTTLEHPPPSFSPDPDPAGIHPFLRLKYALKGRRFCDGSDIINNAAEELKRFPQNGFQEYFLRVYSRWQKCIIAQRGPFSRNLSLDDCTDLYFSGIK